MKQKYIITVNHPIQGKTTSDETECTQEEIDGLTDMLLSEKGYLKFLTNNGQTTVIFRAPYLNLCSVYFNKV